MLIDTLGLGYFAGKISKHNVDYVRGSLLILVLIIGILTSSLLLSSLMIRIVFAVTLLVVYSVLALKQLRRDNVFTWLASSLKRT